MRRQRKLLSIYLFISLSIFLSRSKPKILKLKTQFFEQPVTAIIYIYIIYFSHINKTSTYEDPRKWGSVEAEETPQPREVSDIYINRVDIGTVKPKKIYVKKNIEKEGNCRYETVGKASLSVIKFILYHCKRKFLFADSDIIFMISQ